MVSHKKTSLRETDASASSPFDLAADGKRAALPETILIVDDEAHIVSVLSRVLTREGYAVTTASDAIAALAILETTRFAALVTDVQMPGMRGDELWTRARAKDPDIVVVVVTATMDTKVAASCREQGVSDYITKPFDILDLTLRLRKALQNRRAALESLPPE
jgi:CheY-like chemotaxis protein